MALIRENNKKITDIHQFSWGTLFGPFPTLQTIFPGILIPDKKMRWSWEYLFFLIRIPILARWYLYIEMTIQFIICHNYICLLTEYTYMCLHVISHFVQSLLYWILLLLCHLLWFHFYKLLWLNNHIWYIIMDVITYPSPNLISIKPCW